MYDGKQLAARAYLMAAKMAGDDGAAEGYRSLAKGVLDMQEIAGRHGKSVVTTVEQMLDQEAAKAGAWYTQVVADEAAWIAAGVDVDAAFAKKYYREPAHASSFRFEEWVKANFGLIATAAFFLVVVGTVGVCILLARWIRRRSDGRVGPSS